MLNYIFYLKTVLENRLKAYFDPANASFDLNTLELPDLLQENDPLSIFIAEHSLSREETVVLLMTLVPHVQPFFWDNIIHQYLEQSADFPQIGGVRGKQFRGFLPTGETALFVLAGDDFEKRLTIQNLFNDAHLFYQKQILRLEDAHDGEPHMSGRIILSPEFIELFTTGEISKPRFGMSFPAERIETKAEWGDLILPAQTLQQVNELFVWLKHGDTLLRDWGMDKYLKPGYRALFYGPPGTGKTMTASLLGKMTGRDVFRIDLSMVISKYIGETEKNLANLFDKAEHKDWILFFDEADALFGKRTSVRDAHDRYANQEVSYLLQRVETYNGLVILASNFKSNIDDAFVRRFQSIIHFPMPKPAERLKIWQNTLPKSIKLDTSVNLSQIAEKYEISGASIVNIVQFCCLRALDENRKSIRTDDIKKGIEKEFGKEGKIVS
jgi:hypothetical protein